MPPITHQPSRSPGVGVDSPMQPDERRRQIRKGTRSCWECRRRKVRCKFDDTISRDVCRSCRRRGAACVGQDFSEETSNQRQPPVERESTGGRLERLEKLVGHILDGEAAPGRSRTSHSPVVAAHPVDPVAQPPCQETSAYDNSPCTQDLSQRSKSRGVEVRTTPTYEKAQDHYHSREAQRLSELSQKLIKLLPSREDCVKIYRIGGLASFCYQQIVSGFCGDTWTAPGPDFCEEKATHLMQAKHPALIAKMMLDMAATLQRTRPPPDALSEHPEALRMRLADAAISLVCNDDQIMGSVEGLECLVTQTAYLGNEGNLRLSLLACRRAITIAQLMGLHQPHNNIHVESVEANRSVDPRLIWFCIVYIERLVCLLLGLPDTARDMNDSGGGEFSSLTIGNTVIGQLQRAHSIVASQIIQRNQTDPFFRRSGHITSAMDLELERAAARMPPRWWSIPRFSNPPRGEFEYFLEVHKLSHQLFHYFLLVELHLPFILRPSSDPDTLASKLTCINASRDGLARFVAAGHFRELSLIPEASDFFALIAAIALLLAHINAHRAHDTAMDVSLRHQRLTDRALLQDTLDFLRGDSSRSSDMLSKKSSVVLRRLLEIEEDAAAGQRYTTSPGTGSTAAECEENRDNHRDFHFKIPYFGTLVISPDRPVTRAPLELDHRSLEGDSRNLLASGEQSTGIAGYSTLRPEGDALFTSNLEAAPASEPAAEGQFIAGGGDLEGEENGVPCPVPDTTDHRPGLQQGEVQNIWHPNISARVEDWAFQGVDAAFFDSIMRGLESPTDSQPGVGFQR